MLNSYALGSATNLDTTTWLTLALSGGSPGSVTGSTDLCSQIARFMCICVTAGGVGTLGVALVDASAATDVVVALYKATITATADRCGSALATGSYLCTTAFGDGTDKLDLLAFSQQVASYSSAGALTGTGAGKLVWKIGLYSATATGAVTCRVADTRAI